MTDIVVVQVAGANGATTALTENELLRLAASAERGSEHPLGEAIVEEAQEPGLHSPMSPHFSAMPGARRGGR